MEKQTDYEHDEESAQALMKIKSPVIQTDEFGMSVDENRAQNQDGINRHERHPTDTSNLMLDIDEATPVSNMTALQYTDRKLSSD